MIEHQYDLAFFLIINKNAYKRFYLITYKYFSPEFYLIKQKLLNSRLLIIVQFDKLLLWNLS